MWFKKKVEHEDIKLLGKDIIFFTNDNGEVGHSNLPENTEKDPHTFIHPISFHTSLHYQKGKLQSICIHGQGDTFPDYYPPLKYIKENKTIPKTIDTKKEVFIHGLLCLRVTKGVPPEVLFSSYQEAMRQDPEAILTSLPFTPIEVKVNDTYHNIKDTPYFLLQNGFYSFTIDPTITPDTTIKDKNHDLFSVIFDVYYQKEALGYNKLDFANKEDTISFNGYINHIYSVGKEKRYFNNPDNLRLLVDKQLVNLTITDIKVTMGIHNYYGLDISVNENIQPGYSVDTFSIRLNGKNNFAIGDNVLVYTSPSGQYIYHVIKNHKQKDFPLPTTCTHCNKPLKMSNSGRYCNNNQCTKVIQNSLSKAIIAVVDRKIFENCYLGDKEEVIPTMIDKLQVQDVYQFLRLEIFNIKTHFPESYLQIYDSILSARHQPVHHYLISFLFGYPLKSINREDVLTGVMKASFNLSKEIKTLKDYASLSAGDWEEAGLPKFIINSFISRGIFEILEGDPLFNKLCQLEEDGVITPIYPHQGK